MAVCASATPWRKTPSGYLRLASIIWLFSDTPRGACASATYCSLIEMAKANSLEPYAYLQYVLQHIAAADTVEKLEALLPWSMK